jgi:hypothetical protein
VCFVCVPSTLYDNYNGLTYTTTIIVLFRECAVKDQFYLIFTKKTYITKSTFDIQEVNLKRKQNLCKSWTCICMQLWRTTSNKLIRTPDYLCILRSHDPRPFSHLFESCLNHPHYDFSFIHLACQAEMEPATPLPYLLPKRPK